MRFLLLVTCLISSGCASGAKTAGMTLAPPDLAQLPGEVASEVPRLFVRDVRGGSETHPLGSPQVSDEDFRAALEASFEAAGVELSGASGALALEAELLELEYPTGALDMPAHLTVRYRVFEPEQGQLVFDHTIRTGYLMYKESAFTGVKRVRLAIEGAARDNIRMLIQDLAAEL